MSHRRAAELFRIQGIVEEGPYFCPKRTNYKRVTSAPLTNYSWTQFSYSSVLLNWGGFPRLLFLTNHL